MKQFALNEKQQQAVTHFEGPMMVLSVAGSGKTHVLTERIVHLIQTHSVNPTNLLAITFARKAATEMLYRLETKLNENSEKLTVCTFHSLGYRILKEVGYPATQFKLIQNNGQMEVFYRAVLNAGVTEDPAQLLLKVSTAKTSLVSPRTLATSEDPDDQTLAKVYLEYEFLKRRQCLVDYDDLLCLPYQLLSGDADLLQHYQKRFQFILVDEFQDSSKVMVELVRLLTNEHRNIWACGDDDQIVHEFRGAKPDVFINFEQYFNGDLQTITMNQNYRSSKNILDAANRLISHNQIRVKKAMTTNNSNGEPIRVLEARDELAEAALIAEEVSRLRDTNVKYSEIAVLARVHRLMPLIEVALLKSGIPYASRNGHLFNRVEVKAVLATMKYLFTNEATKGLDVKKVSRLRKELFPGPALLTLKDAFDIASCYVLTKSPGSLAEDEQTLTKAYLDAFEQVVAEHDDFNELVLNIDTVLRLRDKSIVGVHLLTIHQSKGLEFDAVIIPGANEGILPHFNAIGKISSIEEERRLMYVATTRARNHLVIIHRKRQDGQTTLPSRFIGEMNLIS